MKMELKKTYKCPFCGNGKMITKIIDYEIVDASGDKDTIPAIEVDICDTCGEKFFGYEAALKLEQVKKKGNRFLKSKTRALQANFKFSRKASTQF